MELTEHCLESIWENTDKIPYQIVIVEDGSSEPVTNDWLKSLTGYQNNNPPVLLSHLRNQGYTEAVNTGIWYALERLPGWRFLVLLNNDTEVQPGWLSAMNETAEKTKGVGIIGVKLLSMSDPDKILHGGTLDLLGTHKGGSEKAGHCSKRSDEVWVTFACVGITSDAIVDCGLLDKSYVNFCSDSDYCLTARAHGYRVVYQPECRVYHVQNATVKDVVDGKRLVKDQQRLLDKWGGAMLQGWLKELPFGLSRQQGR